jgi:hypothetical protein
MDHRYLKSDHGRKQTRRRHSNRGRVILVRVLYTSPQNKENCIPCNTADGNNRVTTTTVDQKSERPNHGAEFKIIII